MVHGMSSATRFSRSRIAPQGWFDDPLDQTRQRFWSGQQWLDFTRDPRHPARLVKRNIPADVPPPTVDPWWKVLVNKILIPGICALLAAVLLTIYIAVQQDEKGVPIELPVIPVLGQTWEHEGFAPGQTGVS